MEVKQLIVSIELDGTEKEVGELVLDGNRIFFKYYPSFIDLGLEISPLKMKLSTAVLSADQSPFDGLFGVFADSLPDGWGRLLLDRTLAAKGIPINQVTPLDRLAYIGLRGMGALIYRPEVKDEYQQENVLELDEIAKNMHHVLEGISSDVIEELYSLGGSSGGARPKIFVGYNSLTDHTIHGKEELPAGYEHWIIKFPSSTDLPDIAQIEYAYYEMALDAGIEMNESKLFKGVSGKYYFGTKRFDRVHGKRLHMLSAAGLIHDNFRLSNIDYGHLMDAAFKLENHVGAYEKILRQAAYNVYAHNRDDHSKNFSFLMDHTGNWKVAPAYDLTFSTSSHGMHSTMVSGESKSPGKKHLLDLADYFRVKNADALIERVQDAVFNWNQYASQAGVEKDSMLLINKAIQSTRR